jgi:phenylpyruvate tautomerase PptA (4-oxalocrotonate tautomerase family)
MPTYVCYVHPDQVTAAAKAKIAARIAQIHHQFTGAPVAFTQCVFCDLGPDGHFIGGQPAPGNGVWVYGHIRAERTASARNHIMVGIRDLLTQVLKIPESVVWVYLNELAHTDMIEFGRVLPEPGAEQRWLDQLSPELREHLVSLDHGADA